MSEKRNVHKNRMAEKHCDTENIFTTPGNAFHSSVVPHYYADNSLFSDC